MPSSPVKTTAWTIFLLPWITSACVPSQAESIDYNVLKSVQPLPPASPQGTGRCQGGVVAFAGQMDFLDVAEGVANAPQDSTLYICPGRYSSPFSRTSGWPFTIASVTGDPADVQLQPGTVPYIFQFPGSAQRVRLSGLTLTGARPHSSAAVLQVGRDAVLDIQRCVIENGNHPNAAAIVTDQARAVRVSDSIFSGARATGAIDVMNNLLGNGDTWLVVERSRFEYIASTIGGAVGLGNNAGDAKILALFRDVQFIGNSGSQGGAIAFNATRGSQLHIQDCSFVGNHSVGPGGAIYTTSEPGGRYTVRIRDSVFTDNTSDGDGTAAHFGGGLPWEYNDTLVTIRGSTFHRNVSINTRNTHAAINTEWGCHLVLEDVDLGTGADNNVPADLSDADCSLEEYGAHTSMDHWPSEGIFCELLP